MRNNSSIISSETTTSVVNSFKHLDKEVVNIIEYFQSTIVQCQSISQHRLEQEIIKDMIICPPPTRMHGRTLHCIIKLALLMISIEYDFIAIRRSRDLC